MYILFGGRKRFLLPVTYVPTNLVYFYTFTLRVTGIINSLSENSKQNTGLSKIIDVINNGIEGVHKLKEDKKREQQVNVLIFDLQHFTEIRCRKY